MILHRVLVHRRTRKKLKTQAPDNSNKQQQINNNKFYRQSNNSAPDNRAVVVDAVSAVDVPVAAAVEAVEVVAAVEVEVAEGNEFAQHFVVHLFSGIPGPITLIERTNQH